MATIGATRGTDIPNIDNTLSVSDKQVKATKLSRGFKLTPDSYTTIDELIKVTKEDIMPDLVKTYGDQGLTGFLKLTGALNNGGSSDQIEWWEEGRRHRVYENVSLSGTGASISVSSSHAFSANVQKNDVVMDADTGTRFIVQAGGATTSTSSPSAAVLVKMDNTSIVAADYTGTANLIVLGNIYAQGTNQPTGFVDPGLVRYVNPYMIVKDRYEVNGSQATNIGYVNMGNGDFRWFMYGEAEARKRFEDKRELMMLLGEKRTGSAGLALDNALPGSEGYFSAIENRGINVSSAGTNALDSFAEFDDIIVELDKQGAPSEYAMYVNRKQDLAIDDMLAAGIATGVTAGLPAQFGAFQNSPDMAVQLGFKSFTRGGYTFHKHDWRLLNDPTMLGAGISKNFIQAAMVPMSTVADARSGASVPALSMYYKEANGYSREMEHWVTGGGVLGHNSNGDAGTDQAVFHYRSEIALCVRAANQHVLIKG